MCKSTQIVNVIKQAEVFNEANTYFFCISTA